MEKLFNDLESLIPQEQETAKRELAECFATTKESWIVNGMIDYYAHTNSYRIFEVLVKVQTPHDINIFNKLQKCLLQESNTLQKRTALTLFGQIVRKHPTWLHKVVQHGFLKELLKLLKVERDVTIFMSGLLCIISLLPIIPTSISAFLPDLFEIFNHLAAWTFHPSNVKECELIHLQYGFYMLFNRLYGMYPCNFVDFLRNEYVNKQEKTPIFNHTIRPFLDTVRIHPNLVMSSKTTETNMTRFKKMEPHDVVVECAKYSIESDKPPPASNFLDYPIYRSPMKPLEYTHLMVDLPPLPAHSVLASAKTVENKFESLWSPSYVVLATPPPSSTVPNTPTPTPVPIQPNYGIAMSNANQQAMGGEGSSPPQLIEAAIEATPETTPMKPELKNTFRPYPSNSQTARNIWPVNKSGGAGNNTSSPSSPMKKESQQFQYSTDHAQTVTQPYLDFSGNQKLYRILNDRHHAAEPMSISREDQEVNDINSHNTSGEGNGHQMNDVMMDYDETPETEGEEEEDADTTPPLCNTGFYQCVDYVRRVKRLRMYSHCIYSAGTSPADNTSYMPRAGSSHRLKRCYSWPNLKTSDVVIDSTKNKEELNGSQQQQPSSSPSDEAISAVSHFKKNDQNGNATNVKQNENLYKKIRDDLKAKPFEIVQKVSKGTSTMEFWPGWSAYDTLFYDTIFSDDAKRKRSEELITTVMTTTTTTTSTSVAVQAPKVAATVVQPQLSLSPNEMLEQYIQVSVKNARKNSSDYRDHIELLAIQLQFEKHRREIHAERNRRLLGKSRQIRGLEQSNATMSDQVARLSTEITSLNKKATETRESQQQQLLKFQEEIKQLSRKCNDEIEKNKQLQREKDSLRLRLDDEAILKRHAVQKNDVLAAEIFDLKNLLEKATEEAQRGREYHQRLVKLESEMIIFNDARVKCQQNMEELNALKARDAEFDFLLQSYSQELQETKRILDLKASQVEGYRVRINDLEQQVIRKDISFSEQKRLIASIKDVHEEKFKALEEKYAIQKSVLVKYEEHILELTRNQAAVTSPESERTADLVGYSSPLSISLASSDGLSASLRSTTEHRNIQPLVIGNAPLAGTSGVFEQQQQQQQSVIYPSSQPSLQRQQSIHDDGPLSSNAPDSSTQSAQRKK